MRVIVFVCIAGILLSGCQPKASHRESVEYLCSYQQQLMSLNIGMSTFKDVSMRGAYHITNSPDPKAVAGPALDSIIIAAATYADIVDSSITALEKIKPVTDRSKLMDQTILELTHLSAFCRKDFRDYCLHAKDSIDTRGEWMERWSPAFARVAGAGERLAEYQQDYGREAKLTAEDYEALMKCQGQ